MKTYIVTEKQIEEIENTFSMDGNGWWFVARMAEWVETLETGKDLYFCECEERNLDYICPCAIKQ